MDDFDEFYRATHRRLLRQLALVTGDAGEAEDLLQEAYARAVLRWDQVRAFEAPEAWVRRVALNLARDLAKRGRRRIAAFIRHGPPPAVPGLSPDSVDLARALATLPLRQRVAVVLHHVGGLTVEEVAAELGSPAGTVKTLLYRGRAAMARQLGDEEKGRVLHHG